MKKLLCIVGCLLFSVGMWSILWAQNASSESWSNRDYRVPVKRLTELGFREVRSGLVGESNSEYQQPEVVLDFKRVVDGPNPDEALEPGFAAAIQENLAETSNSGMSLRGRGGEYRQGRNRFGYHGHIYWPDHRGIGYRNQTGYSHYPWRERYVIRKSAGAKASMNPNDIGPNVPYDVVPKHPVVSNDKPGADYQDVPYDFVALDSSGNEQWRYQLPVDITRQLPCVAENTDAVFLQFEDAILQLNAENGKLEMKSELEEDADAVADMQLCAATNDGGLFFMSPDGLISMWARDRNGQTDRYKRRWSCPYGQWDVAPIDAPPFLGRTGDCLYVIGKVSPEKTRVKEGKPETSQQNNTEYGLIAVNAKTGKTIGSYSMANIPEAAEIKRFWVDYVEVGKGAADTNQVPVVFIKTTQGTFFAVLPENALEGKRAVSSIGGGTDDLFGSHAEAAATQEEPTEPPTEPPEEDASALPTPPGGAGI